MMGYKPTIRVLDPPVSSNMAGWKMPELNGHLMGVVQPYANVLCFKNRLCFNLTENNNSHGQYFASWHHVSEIGEWDENTACFFVGFPPKRDQNGSIPRPKATKARPNVMRDVGIPSRWFLVQGSAPVNA